VDAVEAGEGEDAFGSGISKGRRDAEQKTYSEKEYTDCLMKQHRKQGRRQAADRRKQKPAGEGKAWACKWKQAVSLELQ
jgi:hypothetical protein